MTTEESQRVRDRDNLEHLIESLPVPPPCRRAKLPQRDWWTSDHPSQQMDAAALCVGCGALQACRQYGLTHRQEWGTYGALTNAERHTTTKGTTA